MKQVCALALFSGGLDSILACRVVAAQGIRVVAIKFVSPFFDYYILSDPEGYKQEVKRKYQIDVRVEDITLPYLQLLKNPAHGFGKNFNPCIDCKIFMLGRAKEMMAEVGASFLLTGEVLGQRPMSQRRDALNVIERDSGNRTILLRPLCAKLLKETEAETTGLVDRDRLLDFSGRGRSRQIALAHEFGITDFPSPAGGCKLADPILSRRIARMYAGEFGIEPGEIGRVDILLLLVGRQFRLPGGGWLILGRDEKDNTRLEELAEKGDMLLWMESRPGPTAILRRAATLEPEKREQDVRAAASLVVRYAKKMPPGQEKADVTVLFSGKKRFITAAPAESYSQAFR
jgi:hypothetical protein